MDAIRNPFAPGAGSPPPELAGRDELLETARVTLHRVRLGRPEKGLILLGLRGVGKTVLLNHIANQAREMDAVVLQLEAPEGQRLAQYLAPALRDALLRLSRSEKAKDMATRALAALRGFAGAFKVSIGEVEISLAPPTADSGNLEVDLPALLLETGRAARVAESCVVLLVDEVQYLDNEDLRALVVSFHMLAQQALPVVFFGAGLPQVAALAGEARSYAERLFEYPAIGPLDPEAARLAIRRPLLGEGVDIEPPALERIVAVTQGYAYFLQEWGKHAWLAAGASPITVMDVETAATTAIMALDRSFFRVRFDRLTPREQGYLRAMAELGAGPHRSGAIADLLGKSVESLGPLRSGLIRKGMIYSPLHGDTAFTVPLFDAFMRRAMPLWPLEGPRI